MPAEGLLPRLRELGRLRVGDLEEIKTKGGKTRIVPTKLETFRFTSPFRNLIEAAAKLYGGEVEEWKGAPTEHSQWQVTTEAAELEVMVPPQDVDVMYERWSGGGRQALCDGLIEKLTDEPCSCDPSDRACKPRTQIVVLLPQIPDLGHWRLVTQSVFAAMEIPATMELLARVHETSIFAHATLALEQRTSKTIADGTRHFAVPVLRLPYSLAEAGLVPTKRASLETGEIIESVSLEQDTGEQTTAAGGQPGEASAAVVGTSSGEMAGAGGPRAVPLDSSEEPSSDGGAGIGADGDTASEPSETPATEASAGDSTSVPPDEHPGSEASASRDRPICSVNGPYHFPDPELSMKARPGFVVCACLDGLPQKRLASEPTWLEAVPAA